ncbi:TPA: UDP-glucose 6-dehydrogenase [Candidatus Dependentiae bacterium]|nr:MAG: Nucleotide sugar dehydrogenase [candidate division TM6 bacterium GW2011_GWF2_36_131]KKQ03225.1 MAG: Nucleotide sugar dehydrogenase [candidate division TM6 bacterium GW2011_GWE2_36_25]HBR70345.1 UDP-glucose 6-dehydrogenase [Candidatus Dependentiae bacterium]HCU00890.1 UDP-glucose 6-dehydrogenase [Candidatus Dependentiae bacterium]
MKKLLLSLLLSTSLICTQTEKICVIGTGYVGLVTGIGLAHLGHDITCIDIDKKKIEMLNRLEIPIYEPGLKELAQPLMEQKKITFSTERISAMRNADILYIAVGTPMSDTGHADLSALNATLDDIAQATDKKKIICIKSTVPVGTCAQAKKTLIAKGADPLLFEIVSNPEFLREGSSVEDFLKADRIVLGCENQEAALRIKNLYKKLIDNGTKCLITNLESSELIKYASNALLATKIAFINEIAQLCNKTGAHVLDVAEGMGMDKRIGRAFLNPGPGFGGSCFPKDTKALELIMKRYGLQAKLINTIFKSNEQHKQELLKEIDDLLGIKTVAVLGLTFKANTDDVRYSFAIDLINHLKKRGALIKAYDPQGTKNMKEIFSDIEYCTSTKETLKAADLMVIVTEWDEFKHLDVKECAKLMRTRCIMDMRNIFDPQELKRNNFTFYNVGKMR